MRNRLGRKWPVWLGLLAAACAALAIAGGAFGHVERASYWPDPAPDNSVKPPAGGKVPKARSLASALKRTRGSRTRVVCQHGSLWRAKRRIRAAHTAGYRDRPTAPLRRLTKRQAARLLKINRRLWAKCRYHEIQPAVTASHNNDRVVIMPGVYTEPTSRKQPTGDPRCADLRQQNDRNESGAVSYAYQAKCPNDQNLIAVIGRAPGTGQDPQPPRDDRNGIPNLGPCIRCNLQIEGSGASADDVIIDAGNIKSGNHGPADARKDVGIRADRADGFVLRDLTVRHAKEHGIYVLETDGYYLDRFKVFYNNEYGLLTFVEDHGLVENCEAAGSGDAGIYPGAGAEGGDQRPPGTPFRYTQEMRDCDSHHNTLGYSSTDGNSVHLHDFNFYDNAMGLSTDVFTAAGHPGFPEDSQLIEHNNFYSNNFNPYADGSDVEPSVPVPVGTGMWIAGGNHNIVRANHFWDNWRRGAMLFAVPDATVCSQESQHGCDPTKVSTSFNNSFYGNIMGVAPNGSVQPNGTDFWWDSFASNTGNCWYGNIPAPGKQITTSPDSLPDCNNGSDPSSSTGLGHSPQNEAELGACLGNIEADTPTCPWFTTPSKPSQ